MNDNAQGYGSSTGTTTTTMPIEELLEDLFGGLHTLTPGQTQQIQRLSQAAKVFARVVHSECPESPDRTVAMRTIREALMVATDAIATKSGGLYR